MKGQQMFTFRVEGDGQFPFDMLRYDGCHPYGQEDAAKIAACRHERRVTEPGKGTHFPVERDPYGRRTIWLASNGRPTPDRWASFGWPVRTIYHSDKLIFGTPRGAEARDSYPSIIRDSEGRPVDVG